MTAKSPNTVEEPPRKRTATVSYPYNPLATCLEIARGVKEIGNGKQAVSRSMLASQLKLDEKSGDFAQKLASTKNYGLIDGRSDFKLTEWSQSFFFPMQDPERERRLALLEACRAPGAFAELLKRYDGSVVPSPELLANVLSREFGIPESWKSRVASFFIKALTLAGALTSDGFIRHKSEIEKLVSIHGSNGNNGGAGAAGGGNTGGANSGRQEGAGNQRRVKPLDPAPDDEDIEQEGVNVWKYAFKGRIFRVETPEDITPELCNKLKRYIDVLNPTNE